MDEKAIKDPLVHLDPLEKVERTEDLDRPDLLDRRDLEVNEAQVVIEADKELRVYQGLQAFLGSSDDRAIKVQLVQRDRLESQGHRARQEPRVIEVLLDSAVWLERGVMRDRKEMLERRAKLAIVERLELLETRVLKGFLDRVDHWG